MTRTLRPATQALPTATLATWLRLWELADDPGAAGYVTDRAYFVADVDLDAHALRRGASALASTIPGICIRFGTSRRGEIWFERGAGMAVEEIDFRDSPESDLPIMYSAHAKLRRNQGLDLAGGPLFGLDLLRFRSCTILHVWRFHQHLSGRAENAVMSLLIEAARGKPIPSWDWQLNRWDTCRSQSESRLRPTERSRRHVGRVLSTMGTSKGLTGQGSSSATNPLSVSGRAEYRLRGTVRDLESAAWRVRVTPYVLHLAAYCLVVGAMIERQGVVLSTSFSSVDGVIGADDVGNWGYDGYICVDWGSVREFGELARVVMREAKSAEASIVSHEEFISQLGYITSDLPIAHSFAESAPIGMDGGDEVLKRAPSFHRVPGAITFEGSTGEMSEARLQTWRWHGAPNLEVPQDRMTGVMHVNTALYPHSLLTDMAARMRHVVESFIRDPTVTCKRLLKEIEGDRG